MTKLEYVLGRVSACHVALAKLVKVSRTGDVPPEIIINNAMIMRWYNTEHKPRMSKVAKVLSASRYVSVSGEPRYLAVYEIENLDALKSEALKGAFYIE